MPMRILGISTLVRLGYPDPRPFATAAFAIVALWALWQARHSRDLSRVYALGALIIHAYFVLAVAVHENHLYLAVPLLAFAAAARRRLRRIHVALSAVIALNLFLFFGLGRGVPLPPRTFTIIDATVLLAAASLNFLGLGVVPPTPEWGAMLSNARDYMFVAPHVTTAPGLAITIVVIGFNLFGDGLRDALDPRLRD